MHVVEIKVERLDSGLPLPKYMSKGASGIDLYACEDITLFPREIKLVSTGIKVAIPLGFELQIRPRSSLSMQGIGVVNSPGTVDADYRGEIKVILINFGKKPFSIKRGDRIAQAVPSLVVHTKLRVVDKLEPTPRGEEGFGHTGR